MWMDEYIDPRSPIGGLRLLLDFDRLFLFFSFSYVYGKVILTSFVFTVLIVINY